MVRKLLLLVVAAIVITAMVVPGCTPTTRYNLTMAVNPAGGGTTTPTGTTAYASGTVVNIEAVAATGYVFLNWSAGAGTFGDANAATTTFTMPAQDVTVTANFALAFDLTMVVSPPGAGTTTPTGTTPQGAGTGVNIQATPGASYQFAYWSAPAGSFADASAATTVFTMPAEDVTVTAHFVGPLDHGTVYFVDDVTAPVIDELVTLEDQFGVVNAWVLDAAAFLNPTEKVHGEVDTPIYNPDHHLTVYYIDLEFEEDYKTWNVEVENQFGLQHLTVEGPIALAVPTQKEDHEPPVHLDHYLLYWVTEGPYIDEYVYLQDQFGDHPEVLVYEPMFFANPVKKTHGDIVTEILNPDDHAVIYETSWGELEKQVHVANQFGEQTLDVYGPFGLAVPSQKLNFAPAVDHFKTYWTIGLPVGAEVTLEDQFGTFEAVVNTPLWFCNPAEKWHADMWSPILHPDYHLTVYSIDLIGDPGTWAVGINNQFGEDQNLTVFGPVALAVPTHKLFPGEHEPPVDLDHYLLYEVTDGVPVDAWVELYDEFGPEPELLVTVPAYFANPVKKTHATGTTEIVNDLMHLMFYQIVGGTVWVPEVYIANQFGDEQLLMLFDPAFLTVPSWKLYFDPMG